jgi:predicted phage-related endonuclease
MASAVEIVEGTKVELGFDAEARQALTQLVETKKEIARLEKEKKQAEATLREKIGNAEFATFGGVNAFHIVNVNGTSIDREILEKGFPEALEAALKVTPYSKLLTA